MNLRLDIKILKLWPKLVDHYILSEIAARNNACNAAASAKLPSKYNTETTDNRTSLLSYECSCSLTSNQCPIFISLSTSFRYFDGNSFAWSSPTTSDSSEIAIATAIEETTEFCPPNSFPEHTISIIDDLGNLKCGKLLSSEPETDPDCPAPTDNDPFVFGTGSQTNVCYPAPNGRQCEIKTDENGGYYLPISYGSAEPVECVPDPDPEKPDPTPDPEQPDDSTDPDKTPDPEPKPDPDQADDTDKTESIDALNQINDNLNTINNNINSNAESHNDRLDRMAKETQNSNELLASIKQNTSAITTNTGNTSLEVGKSNDLLHGIKKAIDRTNDNLEQKVDPECIGELCELDIQAKLSEEDLKITEWFEETTEVDPKIKSFNQKLLSYVSQNFAGFTGTCQPFVLDVSIANKSKSINVSQHCEPYETYFKPLVEWLLWTFTAIAGSV